MKKLIAMTLVLVCLLCACAAPADKIVGTWKNQKTVLGIVTETTYVFREDGTGKRSGILDVEFTYDIIEDQLVLTFSAIGLESKETYSYAFEGDTLTLTGNGETMVLTRTE